MSLIVWSCYLKNKDKNPHKRQLVGVRFVSIWTAISFAYLNDSIGKEYFQ